MINYLLFFMIILSFFQNVISVNYTFYTLSVQKWCTLDYQIHGLWPQYTTDTYPSYCLDSEYLEPKGKLKNKMNKYWSSCNNSDLWEHEWIKHGTCLQEKIDIDEYSYFNLTLDLFLDNNKMINKCDQDECKLACFDLSFNLIDCPKN